MVLQPTHTAQKAFVEVFVHPPEANISVNGLPWDNGVLDKGVYHLSVKHSGYKSKSQVLSIQQLSHLSITISLERDDSMFHFRYPIEEKFVLRHVQGEVSFLGSYSGMIPTGPLEVFAADGRSIFQSIHKSEEFVYRCPQPKEQKSFCVHQLSLSSAPIRLVFHGRSLWFSLYSPQKELYQFDIEKAAMIKHRELRKTTRPFSFGEKLFLLQETDGIVQEYNIESQEILPVHNFETSWLSTFHKYDQGILVASWLNDQLFYKSESGNGKTKIAKPKSILSYNSEAWIVQSEPAGIVSFPDRVLWTDPSGMFVQGVHDPNESGLWILDGSNRSIRLFSLSKNQFQREREIALGEGTPTDLVQTEHLLIVSLHFSGTGFSLGTGEIRLYDKEKGTLIDTITDLVSPSHMAISQGGLLAVGDISNTALMIFDIGHLQSHE